MDFQNFLPPLHIRPSHVDLPVEAAGAQQRRVQNVRPVGCRQNDDALRTGEAIHFHQQLVQCLFLFVVTAAQTGAALAADGVDLVDEHDGRGDFSGLFKQVPDTSCADTHVHFHEIRAGNGQKLHARLSRDSPGKQGLACAGRPHQQKAVGNPCADLGKFFGIFQEIHDFLKLFLFFVRTRNVVKGHFLVSGNAQNRPGFAEGVHGIPGTAHASHQQRPNEQQHHPDHQQRKNQGIGRKALVRNKIVVFQHAGGRLLRESLVHLLPEALRVGQRCGDGGLAVVGFVQLHRNGLILHHELTHLFLIEQLNDLGIGQGVLTGGKQVADPA